MIDIVDLKNNVTKENIKFYLREGFIYCENLKTSETVIVGDYSSFILKVDGIVMIFDRDKEFISFNDLKNQIKIEEK